MWTAKGKTGSIIVIQHSRSQRIFGGNIEDHRIIEALKQKVRCLEKELDSQINIKQQLDLAEKELASIRVLLSSIIDSNPIPTFILNKDHKVRYWNTTLEKISGINANDIIGTRDAWRAFYDEKRPVMADLIIDGADERQFWASYKNNSEYTTLHKSSLKKGAYESQDFFARFGDEGMWLLANACPLTDDKGDVIGAIETFQDISKLIKAQKESRKNEKKYRSLFERAGDAFFLMVNDHLIDCNALSLKLFNCSHEDILGHSIFEFFPEFQPDGNDSQALFHQKIVQAYGGENQRFYWKFSGFFSKEFDADVTLSRVRIHGRYVIQAVVRDITETVKAEKELANLRRYLSNIINSMPSVLIGITDRGRVTHWNLKAGELTGVRESEAIGKPVDLLFPRIEDRMVQIRQAIKTRRIFEENKIPREVNDDVFYENLTVYPLVGEDIKGAVIRIDDVTDQVRIEEMMIQSEKMVSVGSLAAGLAHEINNPLAGMMQNAQVLSNRLSGQIPANEKAAADLGLDPAKMRRYFEKREIMGLAENINNSGKRAAKIIRNVLSFSRKSKSRKMAHSLPELLDQTIEIASSDYDLKTDYDFKQIEICREYEKDLPAVLCDESKIQQVFWNILKNGAEAMQETQTASRFHMRIYRANGSVRVEISDNGPGMDDGTRKRLFEPFFTTKGKGTGLGLAISYFIIVKDHGGKLGVESERGAGSKFIIQLNS